MSFRSSRFPILHNAPIQLIQALEFNGVTSGTGTINDAIVLLTSQGIKVEEARTLGLMFTITAVTGTLTLNVIPEFAETLDGPWFRHQGEGNGVDNGFEALGSVATGSRYNWWNMIAPCVRIAMTVTGDEGEAVSISMVRLVAQS